MTREQSTASPLDVQFVGAQVHCPCPCTDWQFHMHLYTVLLPPSCERGVVMEERLRKKTAGPPDPFLLSWVFMDPQLG